MKQIVNFLSRFQNLTPPHDAIKRAVAQSLHETLHISCAPEKVSISKGVAYLRVSSVAKNTIQINRSKVLENLFERLPKARDTVRDIR